MHRFNFKTFNVLTMSLVAASLVASAGAAISVGPAGAGPLTFDVTPDVGEFATTAIIGGGGGPAFVDTAGLDAFIVATPAATIITFSGPLPTTATIPPSFYAYAFRRNTTGNFVQSRPTTFSGGNTNDAGAAVIMLATLQNDTGADQSAIQIEYDLGVSNQMAGELPGHRVYFTVTGEAGSWQVIPELSGVDTDGRLSAPLTLGSWPSGSLMYLLWVDDNADQVADPAYTIDNMTIALGTGPKVPVTITSQTNLTDRTLAERQGLVYSISATGNPIQYQWFHGGVPLENGTNCVNGHDRVVTGARSATLRISSVEPLDSGEYQCVVSNPLNTESSVVATLTVTPDTDAPAILYAYPGINPNEIIVVFSEPMNDACLGVLGGGAISDPLNWSVDDIGGDSLSVIGFTNMTDLRGQTTLGLMTSLSHNPALPFQVTVGSPFFDTAVAQNVMTQGTYRLMTPLFTADQLWSYHDQDVDPGPDWFATDPGGIFPLGIGAFDAFRDGMEFHPNGLDDCRLNTLYDLGAVGTCLSLQSPVTLTNLITAYFWTHFNFTGNPGGSDLFFLGKADDGAVIYLNGREVQRIRMAPAPTEITHTTFAAGVVGDFDPRDRILLASPPELQSGDNLLAISLHQATLISRDLTLGFQLFAAEPSSAVRVSITISGGNPVISWSPAGGTLEFKNNLADPNWTQLSTSNPFTDTSGDPHRFYRVFFP